MAWISNYTIQEISWCNYLSIPQKLLVEEAPVIWREATVSKEWNYRKTSNISRSLVGNKFVDISDVVGASPVGAAPTTSSFST